MGKVEVDKHDQSEDLDAGTRELEHEDGRERGLINSAIFKWFHYSDCGAASLEWF